MYVDYQYDEKLKDPSDLMAYQWIFGDFSSRGNSFQNLAEKNVWQPPMDIYETDHELHIILELAGMEKSQINVAVRGNNLFIHGVRREPFAPAKRNYHTMEINFGPFERIIYLPDSLEKEKIVAQFKNGFLELVIPKIHEQKEQKIQIKIL